jgi:hypothetical protein
VYKTFAAEVVRHLCMMAAYILRVGIVAEAGRYVAVVMCQPESGSDPDYEIREPFDSLADAAAAVGGLITNLADRVRTHGHRIGGMQTL